MAQLTLALDRFTVVKRRDVIGKDEPYLWVYGLKIDASGGVTPDRNYIIERSGAVGNLGGDMSKGDSRAVPAACGRIEVDALPIAGKILVAGLIVMAWDHDNTPGASVQGAYHQTGKMIDDFITAFIPAMLAEGAIRDPNAAELKKLQADIEGEIRRRFKATVMTGLPWTLNQDDYIGENDFTARIDGEQPFHQDLSWAFAARGTEYTLTGHVDFVPDGERRRFFQR